MWATLGQHKLQMRTIDIFVYTASGVAPRRLQLDADATVDELLKAAKTNGDPGDELAFLEDSDEPLDRTKKLVDCGIKEKSVVHCHRCRHVLVTVNYNGVTKQNRFPPSATVARVQKWAVKEFGLKGQDAEDKVLRTDANAQPLEPDTHIGTLTPASVCALNLYLTPLVLVEG